MASDCHTPVHVRAEAGVPRYEATNWWGILAPAGTPSAIIERLHLALSVILASAETQKRFHAEGAQAPVLIRATAL